MDAIREATRQLGRGESLLTPDMSSSQGVEQPGEPPSPAHESRHATFMALLLLSCWRCSFISHSHHASRTGSSMQQEQPAPEL